jgi:hypothetical protein
MAGLTAVKRKSDRLANRYANNFVAVWSILRQFGSDSSGWPTITDDNGLSMNMSGSALSAVDTPSVPNASTQTLGHLPVPAGDVEADCAFTGHLSGFFSTASGSAPSSANFAIVWGSTAIASLSVPAAGLWTGASGAGWWLDFEVDFTSTTAAECVIKLGWHTGTGVAASVTWHLTGAQTGLTTTAARNLSVQFTWGSAPSGTQLQTDVCRIGRAA